MTLKELINIIDNKLDSDILANNRKRHNVYARKVYCKLAYNCVKEIVKYENGVEVKKNYTLKDIADTLGKNHDVVYYHRSTFHAITDVYKTVYNAIIEDYSIESIKVETNKTTKLGLTATQKSLLSDLVKLSDSDIIEFRETRLKPYLNMIESRVKPKVIRNVMGAMIKRR